MRLLSKFLKVALFLPLVAVSFAQTVKSDLAEQGTLDLWYYILIVLGSCLLAFLISKIIHVYEVSRELEGKKSINWNSLLGIMLIVFLVVGLYGVYWVFSTFLPYTLPEAASVHGKSLDLLLEVTAYVIMIPFVLTQILVLSFPFIYRHREGRKALFYPDNHILERGWAGIISVVMIVLVGWGFYIWSDVMFVDHSGKDAVKVNVTGEQFKWTIRYAGDDGKFGKTSFKLISPENNLGVDFNDLAAADDKLAGEIVLPVGQPVDFKIDSKDVLHSFFLPHFRVQINAVPGMDTHFKFTPSITTEEMRKKLGDPKFDYVLLCNKICGGGHYNMQAKVRIVTPEEYAKWIKQQPLY